MGSDAPAVGAGWVAIVGGGPGDPGLITRRGWQLLTEADVVLTDHLAPLQLLDELRDELGREPEVIDAAKHPRGRSMPQDEINALLIEHAQSGRNVVRLKGGDPFVFGRGSEEVAACAEAGLRVHVVPGVTSAIAVPGLAGVPVTHRELTHAFTVVSGHLPPNHPDSLVDWDALARSRATLVVLMGVKTMPQIAAALLAAGLDPSTPTFTVIDGASAQERRLRARLAELGEVSAQFAPPGITVIGAVAALS